ncbi:unnamed protein product, partial [Effrenium voratum]
LMTMFRKLPSVATWHQAKVNPIRGGLEPAEVQVLAYADYLGIQPEERRHLLWIAKEGVDAALPAPWQKVIDEGDTFYYNPETNESRWDHPLDEVFFQLVCEHRD